MRLLLALLLAVQTVFPPAPSVVRTTPREFPVGSVLAAVPPGSTLLNDLVAYWPLDETSGTRYDSVGSNDLTDNNTVGSVNSGPSGTVGRIVTDSSEYLSNTGTSLSTTYTVAAWVKAEVSEKISRIFCTKDGLYANVGFTVGDADEGSIWVQHSLYDGIQWEGVPGSWTGPAGVNPGWVFIVATNDQATKTARLYANNVERPNSPDTYAGTTGNYAATEVMYVGSGVTPTHTGGIVTTAGGITQQGPTGYWSRVLDASEMESLFNSGAGKKYADLTTAEKVGLVSYWDLSETSGTRADSHGSNDLTDNNTVGSVTNASGAMHNAAASFVAANSESLSLTAAALPATGSYSISGWFNVPSPADARTMISEYGAYSGGYPINFILRESLRLYLGDGTPNNYTAAIDPSTAPPTATWFHVLFTLDRDADEAKLYLNNSVVTTVTPLPYATQTGTVPFRLGATAGGEYGTFVGDEISIWSRVLTADEREELFNLGAGKFLADQFQ